MTPTWYDLLDVEPDASEDEIRAAWKAAIADLDPTNHRFRTLNEAAEVLLDPDRRAAYDGTLAEDETSETRQVETPLTRPKVTGGAQRGRSLSDGSGETEAQLEAPDAAQPEQDSRTTAQRTIPAWLLAALAVLVAIMLATAGYLVSQPSDESIANATTEAQSAAERAATTILAYDWQSMDEDQKAAEALMTPSYQKEFAKLFEVLKENQPTTKTVVTVDKIVASGIVRSGDDRVQVLVFVNRHRTNAQSSEPVAYRDQVVMTMVKSGDNWLVDNMNTNQLAS